MPSRRAPATAVSSPSPRMVGVLHPSGRVTVAGGSEADAAVVAAFALGTGHGVLHLGATEVGTALDPSLAYWRELGALVVRAACGAMDPASPEVVVVPPPDVGALSPLVVGVPPMRGAELVSEALLRQVWDQVVEALAERSAAYEDGVSGYLHQANAVWHLAGRVCLHLAENRSDPDYPFAFLATYARLNPGRSRVQHVPLARALQEYAGQRSQLLALLKPLQRAAEASAPLRELVASGDVYHPLAWTAAEAYALLQDAALLQRAGVVLRLPDWWSARRRSRPIVGVTVGTEAPSTLGLGGLLDFRVEVTLGGEALSEPELAALLGASAGLVLLKGRWVEVDPDALAGVLGAWRAVEEASASGLGFGQAMRLLAGAGTGLPEEALDPESPAWSEVVAGRWLAGQLDALRSPTVSAVIEAGATLDADLRPYQQVGLQWLWSLYGLGLGACLADDMGLGKTIQVLGLLALARAYGEERDVDLLVVPASLVENWRAEAERFAPHIRVLIAHPSKLPTPAIKALSEEEVRGYDVVITTYGTVGRVPWMSELQWRVVGLDEAQAIKNPAAAQTRAVKRLNARWRLALTGTPVENRLGDLWSIVDFLNPGLLGTAREFDALCKTMAARDGDGYAPLRRLMRPYLLRRLKTDRAVIADLPDKIELSSRCLLSKEQAALYQQSVDELARALQELQGMERRGLVLAFLTRLKQICNHPSQWLGDGGFEPERSGKLQHLAELCEPIAERQEKALVFTQYRSMVEPLSAFLATCFGRPGLTLHGGTPVKRRAELVQRFQEDEDVPFLVLSIKAGGTGLNLTAANHVLHFDRWWNPAVEDQATDRAFRIGQERTVLVHKFVCQGTVEERIDALITGKRELVGQVLGGEGEVALTELSNEALLAMVRLDLSAAVGA